MRRAEILERAGRPEEAGEAYARALEAIAALPAGKRRVRKIRKLEQQVREAIERLSSQARPVTVEPHAEGEDKTP